MKTCAGVCRRRFPALTAIVAVLLLALCLQPALSAAQPRPATISGADTQAPASDSVPPAPPPKPPRLDTDANKSGGATLAGSSADQTGGSSAPSDQAPGQATAGAPTAAGKPGGAGEREARSTAVEAPTIALVLPLESPLYGRAAAAVRAGFVAAAAPTDVRYAIVAHGDGDVAAAFERAQRTGARVIVGPLIRDHLKVIAGTGGDIPLTIALNQLDEGSALPPRVYTLTLAIESEGAQLARLAAAEGARSVAIIGVDTPLQRRFASAFVGEWLLQGGDSPLNYRFDRSPESLALLRRELARAAPDAVLLALDGDDSALVRPYVGPRPTYTSSQVNDRQTAENARDLDDVRFVEIPWIADPAGAAYATVRRADTGNPTLDRLYALGIDAFRVARAFSGGAPASLELDGATGRLALDRSHQFQREATVLQFRDGTVIVTETR